MATKQQREEAARLKEFMLDNFDFDTFRQCGFYSKQIKRADYEAQAARVCQYFSYKSVYEYGRELAEFSETDDNVVVGKFADVVSEAGELVRGGGFLLDVAQSAFVCPICTCEQHSHEHAAYRKATIPIVRVKCKGCKRRLELRTDIFRGGLTVEEVLTK